MQQLQDSVFNIVKTTNLSPSVFSYLQPCEESGDKTPLGGILSDTKHGWLALGPKFCVVDLRTGLKVAARTFGETLSNFRTTITSVVELSTPLTDNSQQLLISLECEDIAGMMVVFHINGSQILKCIQTEVVVTQLAVCDGLTVGPFTCFDGVVMAGTKSGAIFVFDLNRASLIQALKDLSNGYDNMIRDEENSAKLSFLPLNALHQIETQRDLVLENDDHIALLLNENSMVDDQYIFRNPDGTVRMKAKRNHIRVTVLQYIPQLGSIAVGFNFGAFQLWNLMNLDLEFTSQVNVECLPVTQIGFQEPCDDPRAFCYLWVVFSVLDRGEEEEFPLAVMYSLTYQGKRMLSDVKCLYQEFLTATIRFQIELSTTDDDTQLVGGRCIACHTYSVNYSLGSEEDSMLNICQLVWECWGVAANDTQHGMLLFDLDQWYNDQMPATYNLQSNAFMSVTCGLPLSGAQTLSARLGAAVSTYCAAASHPRHLQPASWRCDCICLTTSEVVVLNTIGIQRQIINAIDEIGPTCLLNPRGLYNAAFAAGLTPLYVDNIRTEDPEEQRSYLLSVALEARLSRFLRRCAHDWATGTHAQAGCTLPFLVDWCWKRALELSDNAKELTAPLFTSSCLPDRNMTRCLEHCVQQLTQLTNLLDAVLTTCCNLVVPDALSEMEERQKGISTVSLYYRVVQWLLRCGLLPERTAATRGLPYPAERLLQANVNRRLKLQRLLDHSLGDEAAARKSCPLLYIDQLIEHEFGGERVHELWRRGGSQCNGLYPPPSLYSLVRLYLCPDIATQHKHSLLLYLLVDYSMVYDDVRYEAVIRRLMQFPTMFGLSNTAIKATQAFWHLDHRDFDFALDQLQCLTGNTLSEWQHNVVLSSLLAQKKTQAALQYLHVRKPAPIQNNTNTPNHRVNDHDKLDDWQSCCNLYLARGLVFEALDVIRMCAQNAPTMEDKRQVLNFFFKGCRNTGQLAKILQITMLPFEEEVFIQYLKNCNESQTSDILIMYYLQQARYLEAEQYNNQIKQSKPRSKELSTSMESLADITDREAARDTLVEMVCSSLPAIASTVAHCTVGKDFESYIIAPKPMSVYVQASSPKNAFRYKSSFIQDTIGNASEMWINKPKARRGLKRALNIEETPFICTPKLNRNRSMLVEQCETSSPPKRPRVDPASPKTPKNSAMKLSAKLSAEMSQLLDLPDVQSPDLRIYDRAETPHSILKTRSAEGFRGSAPVSPVDSRYLGESDDEMLETASTHTHYSDTTNKHLRFTIPTPTEPGSSPSPDVAAGPTETQRARTLREKEMDISVDSYVTSTESRAVSETHSPTKSRLESLESPKKTATEGNIKARKPYKDTVRARQSLSISANSSLSDDPNTSVESIADIPITLVNPRYSGERRPRRAHSTEERRDITQTETQDSESGAMEREGRGEIEREESERGRRVVTPRGRRGIRASGESTPLGNRSRSVTPERMDWPITPLCTVRLTRSRSRTPSLSPRSSPLAVIPEQPAQEQERRPHPATTALGRHVPRAAGTRSRSRTPERTDKIVESPRLEAITESPTKVVESPPASPTGRSLRSRSRTPEIEIPIEKPSSPRTLRARAKTPEKIMSPKRDIPRSSKKSLTRIVLEANAAKSIKNLEKELEGNVEEKVEDTPKSDVDKESTKPTTSFTNVEESKAKPESIIECTPMKPLRHVPSLMDVTISPIVSKSVLQSSNDSLLQSAGKETKSPEEGGSKSIPAFTINETQFGKSVLHSFDSTADTSVPDDKKTDEVDETSPDVAMKSLPAFSFSETFFQKSVLRSYQSSVGEESSFEQIVETSKVEEVFVAKPSPSTTFDVTNLNKSVLGSYGDSLTESLTEKSRKEEVPGPSIAKNMNESSKKDEDNQEETSKLVSSLMTNDSDSDIQDAVIQKEKAKIVEIEREIHEIEGEMSNDDDDDGESTDESGDGSSGESGDESAENSDEDEEIVAAETDSDASTSRSVSQAADSLDEVISIIDTDDSNTSAQMQKDDTSSTSREAQTIHTPIETKNVETTSEVNLATIDEETSADYVEESGSVDPLNQAQMSLMTDDNSMTDLSDVNLNYSDEKKDDGKCREIQRETPMEIEQPKASTQTQITVEVTMVDNDKSTEMATDVRVEGTQTKERSLSPKDVVDCVPVSSQTVKQCDKNIVTENTKKDSGVQSLEKSDKGTEGETSPHGRKKTKKSRSASPTMKIIVDVEKPASRKRARSTSSHKSGKDSDTEPSRNKKEPKPPRTRKRAQSVTSNTTETYEIELKSPTTRKRAQSVASNKSAEQKTPESEKTDSNTEHSEKEKAPKTPSTRRRSQSVASNKSAEQKTPESEKTDSNTEHSEKEKASKTPSTRRRAQSVASNKSAEQKSPDSEKTDSNTEPSEKEMAPKTPSTRRRSQSVASNKSAEQKTPESEKSDETPRRGRKTPSSGEVRKIMTRRASKELSGKVDESSALDESLTPSRRSTRARSKNVDDDASVASGSSMRSTRSKASEDAGDLKPGRKGRKSIIPSKPDLSVIPELTAEESSRLEATQEIMNEYSTSRRMTRHQKSLLQSWLDPKKPSPGASVVSRASQHDRSLATSVVSRASQNDDESSPSSSIAFDVQPIDRISLLNKPDFEGSPDSSELQSNASPESIASDASKQRRLLRTKRAMSESKSTPKAAKTTAVRRVSVDVVGTPATPEVGSPATVARGRRASFTRAQEALHTPKGTPKRAKDTELKADSRGGSPAPAPAPASEASATPARRPRRASTASQTKPETSATKRTRKASTVEENKETKK